jgi:hypothetical protein
MLMSSTRSEFPADLLAGEPSVARRSPRKRPLRFLMAVGIGVAATLGWQSYGDAAREIIANSYPQLGWLAPQAAAAQAAPTTIAAATASLDQQELKTVALGLAAVRQRVDQLAAQVAAGQEQMTRDFTAKLHAVEQDILDKISQPAPPQAAAPVRKPVPPPAQAAPLR